MWRNSSTSQGQRMVRSSQYCNSWEELAVARYPSSGVSCGTKRLRSSTKFSLNSCSQSGKSCNRSLCTSSDSPFLFLFSVLWIHAAGLPMLLTRTSLLSCTGFSVYLLTSNTESCDEDRSKWRCWWARTRRKSRNHKFWYIAINSLALSDEMWFLTAGPVVCTPMVLAEFRERKNCGSFFKKDNCREWVEIFDIYRGFFCCLHLTVGRHHHRRILRNPHGLQFSRVKVSLADHMHTCSGIYHKLFFPRFYVIGGRIDCSFVLFCELVIVRQVLHASPRGAPLFSFGLLLETYPTNFKA